MKKIILLFNLILLFGQLNAQDSSTLTLGLGANSYGSDVNNSEFVNSDIGVNLGFFTPLLRKERFNLGLNLMTDYRTGSDNFGDLSHIIPIRSREGLSTSTFSNNVDQSLLHFGVGPQFNFKLSNKFWLSPILQAGYFNFNQDEVQVTQENVLGENTFSTEIFTQDEVKDSGLFFKSALRLNFQITKQWSLWAEGNYFLANVNTTQSTLIPFGEPDDRGKYDVFQVIEGAADDRNFEVTERKTSLNNFGAKIGVAYSFGGKKGYDYLKSNKPTSSAFTNVIKERKEQKKPKHQIIGVLPANNSSFEDVNKIKNFTWKVIGNKIPNPQFIIEVNKVNSNQQPQRSYSAKTSKTSINAREVFKSNELADGQYRWKVIETTTGSESDIKFFSLSNCEINLSITNEEIECLGYEGEYIKYQICFDSNYSSPSGDLTFANTGSGLNVFDQSYTALSYTLVSPSTTL